MKVSTIIVVLCVSGLLAYAQDATESSSADPASSSSSDSASQSSSSDAASSSSDSSTQSSTSDAASSSSDAATQASSSDAAPSSSDAATQSSSSDAATQSSSSDAATQSSSSDAATQSSSSDSATQSSSSDAASSSSDAATQSSSSDAASSSSDSVTQSSSSEAASSSSDAATKSSSSNAASSSSDSATQTSSTTISPTSTTTVDPTSDPLRVCQSWHPTNLLSASFNSENQCVVECRVMKRSVIKTMKHRMPEMSSCGDGRICVKAKCRDNTDAVSQFCQESYGAKSFGERSKANECMITCVKPNGKSIRQTLDNGAACKKGHCVAGLCRDIADEANQFCQRTFGTNSYGKKLNPCQMSCVIPSGRRVNRNLENGATCARGTRQGICHNGFCRMYRG